MNRGGLDASLPGRLDRFLSEMPADEIAAELAKEGTEDESEILRWLEIYQNEARASLGVVLPYLDKNKKILEIGAGLCILSLFLKAEGFDIVANEPSSTGFGRFESAKKIIVSRYNELSLDIISLPAEQLDKEVHGRYDFIYSNNVLEHIDDVFYCLDRQLLLLADGGSMLHHCPNYIMPYEPHFSVPVIKPVKALTEWAFARKINENPGLWSSLNFITYTGVRRWAVRNNVLVEFKKGVLYEAFDRLRTDPWFRERHANGLTGLIYKFLVKTRMINLLKMIPPFFVSPMQFVIRPAE